MSVHDSADEHPVGPFVHFRGIASYRCRNRSLRHAVGLSLSLSLSLSCSLFCDTAMTHTMIVCSPVPSESSLQRKRMATEHSRCCQLLDEILNTQVTVNHRRCNLRNNLTRTGMFEVSSVCQNGRTVMTWRCRFWRREIERRYAIRGRRSSSG